MLRFCCYEYLKSIFINASEVKDWFDCVIVIQSHFIIDIIAFSYNLITISVQWKNADNATTFTILLLI